MTKKHFSIDRLSSASMRQAQSEMALMQRDLNKLRDSVAGLHSAIKAPKIKTPRLRTKRTTTQGLSVLGVSVGSLANLAAGDLLGMAGLSSGGGGYTSVAQSVGQNLAMMTLGQRIR